MPMKEMCSKKSAYRKKLRTGGTWKLGFNYLSFVLAALGLLRVSRRALKDSVFRVLDSILHAAP